MSTVTDNDLKELKDLINSKFEQVDRKFEQVNEKIDSRFEQVNSQFIQVNEKLNDMRVEIATLKEGQSGINKRLDSVDNRLNTITLGVFGTIGVLATGLLTFVGKVVFFPNP
jgi:uncharacterized phage infection (PIP) family protein YhgE